MWSPLVALDGIPTRAGPVQLTLSLAARGEVFVMGVAGVDISYFTPREPGGSARPISQFDIGATRPKRGRERAPSMQQTRFADHGEWTTSFGFIIAAVGSATGLGNIWRFPYLVGENGGGAFIIVYLIAVAGLGVPLLLSELAIGQRTRSNVVSAFALISRAMPWKWAGWPAVAASVAILAYYPVIVGWIARYLWVHLAAGLAAPTGTGSAPNFEAIIADPLHAVFWFWGIVAAAALIDTAGVGRGIELANRILMPVFLGLVVLLAGYSLFLPGDGRALQFLFIPDWSALLRPATYVEAVGQAFFSLSLAMGVFVTYGAYLRSSERLLQQALVVAAGDTVVSLISGTMIFPVVFTFGVDPAHGSTLVFVVLPELFATMTSGTWIAIAFFLLLLVSGLTSVVALLEVPVSIIIGKMHWSRPRAVAIVAAAALLLGVPAALGYGLLRHLVPNGEPLLEMLDQGTSDLILPVSGIALALFVGWIWPRADAVDASGLGSRSLRAVWIWLLRVVIPLTIVLVMLRAFA